MSVENVTCVVPVEYSPSLLVCHAAKQPSQCSTSSQQCNTEQQCSVLLVLLMFRDLQQAKLSMINFCASCTAPQSVRMLHAYLFVCCMQTGTADALGGAAATAAVALKGQQQQQQTFMFHDDAGPTHIRCRSAYPVPKSSPKKCIEDKNFSDLALEQQQQQLQGLSSKSADLDSKACPHVHADTAQFVSHSTHTI